jgi:purine-nucleoside phosphorylase
MNQRVSYRQQVENAASYVREESGSKPRIGVVLGTGLDQLSERITVDREFPYEDIPHFPASTVESHEEELLVGRLSAIPVLAMRGRFHLYEGYTAKEVAFPIRVMGILGVEILIISNAAGGMNPHYSQGDIILVTDHINLQGENPLIGPNVDDWGPRFPDMSEPYDPDLRTLAHRAALEQKVRLQEGVYVAVVGPNLETKAEYRFLRKIGGDLVGMSTVPEVLAARHMDIRVLTLSVVTDECFPDALEPLALEDALAAAREADPKVTAIVEDVVTEIGTTEQDRAGRA